MNKHRFDYFRASFQNGAMHQQQDSNNPLHGMWPGRMALLKRRHVSFLVPPQGIIALSICVMCCISFQAARSQNYGAYPKIQKERLLDDLELLYQGLDKFHSGMYWYTPKDSVDWAFQAVRDQITSDMNVLEFHKLIAPLVGYSREDHTNIYLPSSVRNQARVEARFMPLTVVFLGRKLYCMMNGSYRKAIDLEGKQIEAINGESPESVVGKIGKLFASDGYIKTVKYSDLSGFSFAKYYFYYYGQVDRFELKLKGIKEPVLIRALPLSSIRENLKARHGKSMEERDSKLLEYRLLNDSVAYLGIHTFDNKDIKKYTEERKLAVFLKNSFRSIQKSAIKTLIVDVSKNTGGSEGNEGLLYSYFGDNYQKYKKVRVKTQKAVLDNGTDPTITLKAFGFFERLLMNKKMEDGSLERRASIGRGLMAYKKEPDYKFKGKTYVLISPVTYSGGSEFSNMMYSQKLATFVGQETGGGYYGNTSGYGRKLVLPNSGIIVTLPVLQFIMNVEPSIPFGRGVIPHYEVMPTFQEYQNGENAALEYIMERLIH